MWARVSWKKNSLTSKSCYERKKEQGKKKEKIYGTKLRGGKYMRELARRWKEWTKIKECITCSQPMIGPYVWGTTDWCNVKYRLKFVQMNSNRVGNRASYDRETGSIEERAISRLRRFSSARKDTRGDMVGLIIVAWVKSVHGVLSGCCRVFWSDHACRDSDKCDFYQQLREESLLGVCSRKPRSCRAARNSSTVRQTYLVSRWVKQTENGNPQW